ncbi:acetylglutamate kinase, partial [Clostridioides difficile]|nr:acetylglutamate kinase [Clostridioides difficile]
YIVDCNHKGKIIIRSLYYIHYFYIDF